MPSIVPHFLLFAGYIVGLGAVTVIDLHGFLGRNSPYWTQATIQTHKVTKPLIWLGMMLAIIGGTMLFSSHPLRATLLPIALLMLANGCFLSFWVSPRLLKREAMGQAKEILPTSWQRAITVSFLISFASWWGSLILILNTLF